MDDRSIAERLGEISAALRSPLARDLAGEATAFGRPPLAEMNALLEELASVPATTAYDALALASITTEMVYIVAANSEGNANSLHASRVLGNALRSLSECLVAMAGRPEGDFRVRLDAHSLRPARLQ